MRLNFVLLNFFDLRAENSAVNIFLQLNRHKKRGLADKFIIAHQNALKKFRVNFSDAIFLFVKLNGVGKREILIKAADLHE